MVLLTYNKLEWTGDVVIVASSSKIRLASIFNSIEDGKPMLTWPISAEQVYYDHVNEIFNIGTSVGVIGVKEWVRLHNDILKSEAI